MNVICILDVRGILVRNQEGVKKKSTGWVKKIMGVKYYIQEKKFQPIEIWVELPPFNSMDGRIQKLWGKRNEKSWDSPGEKPYMAIINIKGFLEDVDKIFSQQKVLVSRFINSYGLMGENQIQKFVNERILRFHVWELTPIMKKLNLIKKKTKEEKEKTKYYSGGDWNWANENWDQIEEYKKTIREMVRKETYYAMKSSQAY